MTEKIPKILIIEPHSDDSLIAAGGFLLKNKDNFELAFCLVCASDLNFHHGAVARETRLQEYQKYVETMGGRWIRPEIEGQNLPLDFESRLDQVNRSLLVKFFEKVILQEQPDILMFMGPSFHHDHTIVYEAVIAATRPTFKFCPQTIYVMENSTYIHKMYPSNELTPNVYVELDQAILSRKIEAFQSIFRSQQRPKDNALSDAGIVRWAQYRGLEARCDLAEAFYQYYKLI